MSMVRKHRHDNEDGLSIIGVVIASLIIMLALIPAAALLESTLAVSADNQHRVVAANLATQQLETIRNQIAQDSFFTWVSKNGLKVQTTTAATPVTLRPVPQTVGSITYNIATTIQWSAAGNFSTGGCSSVTATSQQVAPVLQVAVSVTWPNERLAQPVTLAANINAPSSIISTTNGSVLLSVVGAGGASDPQNNIPVQLSDSSTSPITSYGTQTATTDETGCSFFPNVPPSTAPNYYTAEVSAPGYVDQAGQPASTQSLTVTAGKTSGVQFVYDKAAYFSVSDPTQAAIASEFGLLASDAYLTGTPGVTPLHLTGPTTYGPVFPNSAGYQTWLGTCPANQFTPTSGYQTAVSTSPGNTSGISGLDYSTLDLTLQNSTGPLPSETKVDIYVWQYGSTSLSDICNADAIIIPVTTNALGQATLNVPTGYFALAGGITSTPTAPTTAIIDATTPHSVAVTVPSVS